MLGVTHANRYNLPIFGVDLVSLPGMHLVCIDLQPAYDSQALGKRSNALLEETKRCGGGRGAALGYNCTTCVCNAHRHCMI